MNPIFISPHFKGTPLQSPIPPRQIVVGCCALWARHTQAEFSERCDLNLIGSKLMAALCSTVAALPSATRYTISRGDITYALFNEHFACQYPKALKEDKLTQIWGIGSKGICIASALCGFPMAATMQLIPATTIMADDSKHIFMITE